LLYAEAVLKFAKLNTAAQQREAVTRGRSLLPYRLRYNNKEKKYDFRFWHKIVEGEERFKAKYESCVGGNVTLINRDGVEIVHKL
jgi:hypothetical protein